MRERRGREEGRRGGGKEVGEGREGGGWEGEGGEEGGGEEGGKRERKGGERGGGGVWVRGGGRVGDLRGLEREGGSGARPPRR